MLSKSLIVAASGLLLALVASAAVAPPKQPTGLRVGGKLIELNDSNWQLMFRGEWMIAFLAPWCQSCADVSVIWDRFAHMSTVAAVHVAEVDVTTSPWISGRFYVTSVPIIYHVKDGEFRQYRGPLYEAALIQFVKKELWKGTEPLSAWMKPDTIHMTIMGFCAKVSHTLAWIKRSLHKDFGLPTWGAYVVVTIGTICVSTALGSLFVCLMDFVNGPPMKLQRHNELQEDGEDEDMEVEDMEVDEMEVEEMEVEDMEVDDMEVEEMEVEDMEVDDIEDLAIEKIPDEDESKEEQQEAEEDNTGTEEHYSETQKQKKEKLQSELKEKKLQSGDKEEKEQGVDKELYLFNVQKLIEYKDLEGDSSSWETEFDTESEVKLVGYNRYKKSKKMHKPRSK